MLIYFIFKQKSIQNPVRYLNSEPSQIFKMGLVGKSFILDAKAALHKCSYKKVF